MTQEKESKTLTMTEEQLQKVIRLAVKQAMHELKEEEELPINDENELQKAPASFSLIGLACTVFLGSLAAVAGIFVYLCVKLAFEIGFNILLFIILVDLITIMVLALLSAHELYKVKKIEILNSVFSAIMALSTLLVAIIGAYFTYRSLEGK